MADSSSKRDMACSTPSAVRDSDTPKAVAMARAWLLRELSLERNTIFCAMSRG